MNLNGKQIPCTDKPNVFAYRAHNLENTNAIFVLSDEVDKLYGVAETFCRISFDFLVFDPFSVCVICHLNRFCRRIIFASWDFASEPGRYDAFSPTFSYGLVVSLLNLLLSLFSLPTYATETRFYMCKINWFRQPMTSDKQPGEQSRQKKDIPNAYDRFM